MSSVATVSLPQVAQITMGQSPSGDTYNDKGDGLPFFQGKAEFGEVSPSVRKWCNQPKKVAEAGDILISVRAPVGPTNLADVKCCIGRGLAGIRANRALVLPEYLRFALRHSEPFLASMGQGSTFAAIGRAELEKVRFPLPSLPEQQRIVDILSRAESIVRLRREAQQKAAELVPAIFLDMFGDPATNPKGWPVSTLGKVVQEFRYGTSQKSGPTGLPVLRIPNVVGNQLELSDMKLVDVQQPEVDRLRLLDGDFLFVRTNGNQDYVGRSAVFNSKVMADAGLDGANTVYASYLIRARVQKDILDPYFLQGQLTSSEGRRAIKERCKTSAGQFNINTDGLGSIPILLPPIALQTKFVRRCYDVFFIQTQQATAKAKAQASFEALLAGCFAS